jgi:hypothetical protein
MLERDYLIIRSMDNEYRASDIGDAIDVWKLVKVGCKAHIKDHTTHSCKRTENVFTVTKIKMLFSNELLGTQNTYMQMVNEE